MAQQLDENQALAVQDRGKALLVLAGAGSGKTHTMIERAVRRMYDVPRGVDPERMLMLTFSRKACREISERLRGRLPPTMELPAVLTYHAYGYRLIRQRPDLCQRRDNPTLMDDADQKRLFGSALKAMGVAGDDLKSARERYDLARNAGLDVRDPRHRDAIRRHFFDGGLDAETETFLDGFENYEALKRQANTLDFNDLQVLPVHGLRDHPEWLETAAGELDEIIVDEAQDTNLVQYRLMYLLGKTAPGSITMVGDDDQTIYGWRGAAPDNLKRFQRDFRPVEIHLENNYRSTPEIVDHASRLIAHNASRLEKTSNAVARDGNHRPALATYRDGEAMAEAVADAIRADLDAGARPGDQAVLYRVNRLAKLVEPKLIARGIPYQVQKGTELSRRQEVQMLFAAIRLAINPEDAPAFAKLASLAHGLGDKRIEQIIQKQREDAMFQGRGLMDIALDTLSDTRAGPDMVVLHAAVSVLVDEGPGAVDLYDWAVSVDPYTRWLKKLAKSANDPRANLESRIQNIELFDSAMKARMADTDQPIRGETTAEQWQQILELTLSTPDEEADTSGKVTLSTIHKAKGLEWGNVHVFGFSDGLIPAVSGEVVDADSEEGAEGLEEERRLAYVAITRAAQRLHLHHARFIALPGQDRRFRLSRFAREMGLEPAPQDRATVTRANGRPDADEDMGTDASTAKANPFARAMGQ